MEGDSSVTRGFIDELHCLDIHEYQKEDECSVTGSIIDEVHCLDIQGDQK